MTATFTFWGPDGMSVRYLTRDDVVLFLNDLPLQGTGVLQKVR